MKKLLFFSALLILVQNLTIKGMEEDIVMGDISRKRKLPILPKEQKKVKKVLV